MIGFLSTNSNLEFTFSFKKKERKYEIKYLRNIMIKIYSRHFFTTFKSQNKCF